MNDEVEIECVDLGWVNGPDDDPTDQCAHSRIRFRASGVELVQPSDGEWTVSASALYLLRSLEKDHQPGSEVTDGNQLFPCCAFYAIPQEGEYSVVFFGCTSGRNVWIRIENEVVYLKSDLGRVEVKKDAWTSAVLKFVQSVREFYDCSLPKNRVVEEEERLGWQAFWKELSIRQERASS